MNRPFARIFGWRVAGVALGVGLFYALDWMLLRAELRDTIAHLMQAAGFPVDFTVFEGSPALRIAGRQIHFTPDCTYIDLVLVLLPFVWRLEVSPSRNFILMAVFTVAVQLVNLLRVLFCTWFFARGGSWFLAHELPDYLLYYPTLALVILWTLRRDLVLAKSRTNNILPASAIGHRPCG